MDTWTLGSVGVTERAGGGVGAVASAWVAATAILEETTAVNRLGSNCREYRYWGHAPRVLCWSGFDRFWLFCSLRRIGEREQEQVAPHCGAPHGEVRRVCLPASRKRLAPVLDLAHVHLGAESISHANSIANNLW